MSAVCSTCGRSISLRPNGMMSPHKTDLRRLDIPVTEDILGFPIPEPALDEDGNPILVGEWTVEVGDWTRPT